MLVPCSVQKSIEMIPMLPNETQTIQVKLKRKMEYKQHYQYETIRPEVVFAAARYLVTTPLYQKYNINLNETWERLDKFIVDSYDEPPEEKGQPEAPNSKADNEEAEDLQQQYNEEDAENCQQEVTLYDSVTGIEYAPGEGETPVSILLDEDCEEMAYPTCYGGYARTHKLTYEDNALSELRRSDRRFVRSDHLFFVHKKTQTKQLQASINTVLRKSELSSNITAAQALDKSYIKSMVDSDNAYRFMSGITGSPAYWEKQKKNVLAMVRQFGIFTFFITLTAAETHWSELLRILKKTVDGEDDADVSELDWIEKSRLIQSDPITCALYFNHRIREVMKTWKGAKDGPFGEYDIVHRLEKISNF